MLRESDLEEQLESFQLVVDDDLSEEEIDALIAAAVEECAGQQATGMAAPIQAKLGAKANVRVR